jgi:hypothetical protein
LRCHVLSLVGGLSISNWASHSRTTARPSSSRRWSLPRRRPTPCRGASTTTSQWRSCPIPRTPRRGPSWRCWRRAERQSAGRRAAHPWRAFIGAALSCCTAMSGPYGRIGVLCIYENGSEEEQQCGPRLDAHVSGGAAGFGRRAGELLQLTRPTDASTDTQPTLRCCRGARSCRPAGRGRRTPTPGGASRNPYGLALLPMQSRRLTAVRVHSHRPYWFNEDTHETKWTRPHEGARSHGPSSYFHAHPLFVFCGESRTKHAAAAM